MNLGFIGLGTMGRPMALNLLKGGHTLAVYARRPEAAAPLIAAGASACDSPAELAARSAVIFTIVSDTVDVEEVLFADNGVVSGATSGSVVVDMSSISPAATQSIAARLAAHGIAMLDAPVSGGERGATDGTLSIMVGGAAATFERMRPLLALMGKSIVHIGDHGAGQLAKLCNQVVIGGTLAAVSEALVLAAKAGVDCARVRAALLGGSAASRVLEAHGERMLARDFVPRFKSRLYQKDMRNALLAADAFGVALPIGAIVASYLNAIVGTGDGDLDAAAIVKVAERIAGVEVNGSAAD
ncbi:MAG: NAD(P)-dependent oxidoreductase [Sulfurifustis sp.]